MAVVGDEGLHGLVAGVIPQQAFERRFARGEVLVRPARLRQGKRGDELVAASLERLDVAGHRIQPAPGVGPKPLDDGGALVREPGGTGDSNIASLFEEAAPIRQTLLETYVVDSTFRPDQVKRLPLEWQVVHRADDAPHPVGDTLLASLPVQDVDEGWKQVQADNRPLQVLREQQRLGPGAAAQVSRVRNKVEIAEEGESPACLLGAAGALPLQPGVRFHQQVDRGRLLALHVERLSSRREQTDCRPAFTRQQHALRKRRPPNLPPQPTLPQAFLAEPPRARAFPSVTCLRASCATSDDRDGACGNAACSRQ